MMEKKRTEEKKKEIYEKLHKKNKAKLEAVRAQKAAASSKGSSASSK